MNRRFLTIALILSAAPFVTGCASTSKTAQGAGIGGAIGAGTGALIGKATNGKAGQGALVGGLIGAGVGGLIGNEKDMQEKREMEDRVRHAEAQTAANTQLPIESVIQLAREGRSDDVIINQMRTTGATYQLTTEDVRMLSSNGVSDRVIMEMQNRRPDMYPRRRLVAVPPPGAVYVAPAPVYVLPPPPPPVGFGVGVHIR
jgi:hypothetical protein